MKKNKKNIIAPVFAILSLFGILFCAFMMYMLAEIQPVEQGNKDLIEVSLDYGIRTIASELEEQGVIRNSLAFILRSQLSGTAGKISGGTYYLSKDMDVDKVISILSRGDHDNNETVMVRIPEGSTIEEIAEILYEANVCYDKDAFLELCKNGEDYINNDYYPYLHSISGDSKYPFEGYLFPDTYEFYYNSKPTEVIDKMLGRFNELYVNDMKAKAKAMGLSTEDVVTLASIIQKEANIYDFEKVAAVLENRMDGDMALQCDSTIRYIKNGTTLTLSDSQYNLDSPYNTYKNKGIPPTPICNPSIEAIKSVINPDKKYIDDKYLYFCSKNTDDGELVFAQTYQEHIKNVKKYNENWKDYDNAVKEN